MEMISMNDYISRQAAIDALAKTMPTPVTPDGAGEFDHEIHIADEAFADAIRIIESLEPADVAPVVRCKDCKHHAYDEIFSCYWCEYPGRVRDTTPDGFCEKGEERET